MVGVAVHVNHKKPVKNNFFILLIIAILRHRCTRAGNYIYITNNWICSWPNIIIQVHYLTQQNAIQNYRMKYIHINVIFIFYRMKYYRVIDYWNILRSVYSILMILTCWLLNSMTNSAWLDIPNAHIIFRISVMHIFVKTKAIIKFHSPPPKKTYKPLIYYFTYRILFSKHLYLSNQPKYKRNVHVNQLLFSHIITSEKRMF